MNYVLVEKQGHLSFWWWGQGSQDETSRLEEGRGIVIDVELKDGGLWTDLPEGRKGWQRPPTCLTVRPFDRFQVVVGGQRLSGSSYQPPLYSYFPRIGIFLSRLVRFSPFPFLF